MKNKQQPPSEILQQIFKPDFSNPDASIQRLNNYGGILSLINQLKTCHRRGLSSNDENDHKQRKKLYGINKQPQGLTIFKKSLLEERDFIVNLLFYLLTLRICVKILLLRDQIRGIHPIGDQTFHFQINAQLMSFFLLITLIILKAKVSVEYYTMDRDERKYKNQKIVVKRDGQRQTIYEQDLMVGDILIIEVKTMIRVDGIVLLCKNLVVSEAHTILKEDSKNKTQIWAYDDRYYRQDKNKDPFILSGSLVTEGYGQVLVCTVGQKCTFRTDKQNKGYYSQYTASISQTKKIMNLIQNICKVITLLLATLISAIYLLSRYYDERSQMTWMDLLYILKVYCGFIGMVCFVQRLKIIKSLQFFIESNRSEKQYRIKNKGSFQTLAKLDILFIQMNTLAMRKLFFRDQIGYQLDHITQISNINNFCKIKIICSENREQISKIFGSDIQSQYIFEPNQDVTYSNHVKSLVQATFITQSSISTFIKEYLPIYKALKYQVGYLYDSSVEPHRDISPQLFQINFQKLIFNPIQHSSSFNIRNSQTNESSYLNYSSEPVFWVKIQKKLFMQDVLYKLFLKAHTYSNLYNVYITIYINNILVFIVTCWFSLTVSVINLTWHLILIISHRFMFVTIYKTVTDVKQFEIEKKIPWLDQIKFNAVMFPYYFFIVNRFKYIGDLFIFFLINGMLRVEVILQKKRPRPFKIFWLKMLAYFTIFAFSKICTLAWYWNQNNFYYEQLDNTKYTVGMFFIYVCYVVFL